MLARVVATAIAIAAMSARFAGAQANGRITVDVVSDTVAIAGATVQAGSIRGRTNEQGTATLSVPAGVVAVVAMKIGYRPDSVTIAMRPGLDTTLVLRIVEQPAVVAPIFVTSTRAERRLEEEPLRIEVLGGDDVSEKSEMRPADTRTLLSELSGVRMQTVSPLGATNVRIQGLPGRYTELLSDGLPLYGAQASAFTLVEVVPLDLRQAEVIKGAASALYGPQALGGVVNLISRRPPDTSQVLVNQGAPASTDVMEFLSRSFRPAIGLTVLGGIHRQRAEDADHDGWTEIAGYRRAELRPRLFVDDSAGHSLMATVGALTEDRASGMDSLATRHLDAGVVARWHASTSVLLDARLSASGDSPRHHFASRVEDDTRRTTYGEATVTHSVTTNTLVAGAAWLRDSYANAQVPRFDATYSTPGVFVQDTYAPARWASGTVNGRCDWSNAYGTICSPRLSVLARTGAPLSVRVSVGSGWYAPRPLTDQTESFGLRKAYEPSPLSAERARTASMDVTMTRGPLQVNGTVFANRVANPVGLQRVAADTTGAVNLVNAPGPLRVHGGELFAVFNQEPFIVTAYYSAARSREVSAESGREREAPLIPRQSAGLDFALEEDESGAYGALEVFYTGRQALEDNPYASVSRPYTTIGVLLSKRWNAATLFLNAENLTNVRMTNFQPLLRGSVGGGGSLTIEPWAPLEGRRFNAGIRWSWP